MIVAGATGYAGALAAELVWRHPRLELVAATSRSEVGHPPRPPLPALPLPDRAHRARPGHDRGRRRGDRRLPARRRRRRWSPRCAASGSRSSTSRPTSGSSTRRSTSAGTRPTASPSCSTTPSTGSPSSTASGSASAELVANPGCYPTAALLALAPLAERGLIASVVIDAKSGVSGAGRDGGERLSLSQPDRELHALRRPTATATCPRSSRSSATDAPPPRRRSRRGGGQGCLHAAPAADRPGPAGELLRRADASRSSDIERLYRRALRGRAVRRGGRRTRPACATCATPTSAGSTRRLDGEGHAVVFAAIDNLWKGAAGPGDPEPEPDARASTRRRAFVSASFFRSRWVDAAGGGRGARPGARLAPGFRAAGVACGLKGGGETDVGVARPATPTGCARRCC